MHVLWPWFMYTNNHVLEVGRCNEHQGMNPNFEGFKLGSVLPNSTWKEEHNLYIAKRNKTLQKNTNYHLLVERSSNVFMQRYSSYETWSRANSLVTISKRLHCSYIQGKFILCLRKEHTHIHFSTKRQIHFYTESFGGRPKSLSKSIV